MTYEAVIGLEVHVQLTTESKAFCSCPVRVDAAPNSTVCPICLGHPGTLPLLNRRLVEDAVLLGLATSCSIRRLSGFSRKHYFYPDLPKGYQITQGEDPICHDGHLEIGAGAERRRIGITRIHMEEDAGKTLHGDDGSTLVDFNRCGTPLLEVVSAPELRTPQEATAYLKELHRLVTWLGICDGNMQEGSFRCDANLSLRPAGREAFGTRTEIKNLNSFRFIERALEAEILRQSALLDAGSPVEQLTLLYDEQTGDVRPMRGKEEAEDYRYLPEPDLPPVRVDEDREQRIRAGLPELPWRCEARLVSAYGLSAADAAVLTARRDRAKYFQATVDAAGADLAQSAAHWVQREVQQAIAELGCDHTDLPVQPERLAALLQLRAAQAVSATGAQRIFEAMLTDPRAPSELLPALGLEQVSSPEEIRTHIRHALSRHPEKVTAYRDGQSGLFSFFMGVLMKAGEGRLDPRQTADLLRVMLEEGND